MGQTASAKSRGSFLVRRPTGERDNAGADFAWCEPRDQVFRRKRFVECYVEEAERSPSLALPAGETVETADFGYNWAPPTDTGPASDNLAEKPA